MITVEYIDPEKEPLRTTQLAEQLGSKWRTPWSSFTERTKYVTSDQMAEMDYSGCSTARGQPCGPSRARSSSPRRFCRWWRPTCPRFISDRHGEAALDTGGASDRSLRILEEALKRENMETADITLLSGDIPEDAAVLAIVGPTRAYTEVEIEALDAFLDRGGRLLVALDPLIEPAGAMRPTRLEAFLADRGVRVRDDLVVDPSRRLPFYDLSAVYLEDFPAHAVTQGLEGFAVLFTVSRSLAADGEGAEVIVQTSDEGWGETDLVMLLRGEPVALGDADNPGPAAVGVAVENVAPATEAEGEEENEFRVVVFGDSDFLTDIDISNAGNAVLAANAFNWLAAREDLVGIPARDVEQVSLFLTRQQMRNLLLLVLVAMPGAAIIAGILVWRKRRH